ncbi:MAG: alpha/beta hydrolase [Phycisphaeraceae bacterium]
MVNITFLRALFSLLIIAFVLPACSATPAVDPATLPDQQLLNLYEGDPPGEATYKGEVPPTGYNSRGRLEFVHIPTLEVYHAKGENRSGAAVVICPGGGYRILADSHEGVAVAKWLSENGITGVILRNRIFPYRHPVPMMDVQRAMQTVRANADAWALDPERIGVLGFSAGGHLASTATVHHLEAKPDAKDPVLRVSSRPDFSVLVYPVITMRPPTAHMGSRKNLLGPEPSDELLDLLSSEKQVNKQTPPTLLVHSMDDKSVPIGNSELFLAALKKRNVPGKLLAYKEGGHGYGLGRKDTDSTAWPDACIKWFETIGVIESSNDE